jgi:hypothetical protein
VSNHSTVPAPDSPAHAIPDTDKNAQAIAAREKAEKEEVAGRHKNDGQMPHKGDR